MNKLLKVLCLLTIIANNAFAQHDSSYAAFKRAVIIKINPALMLSSGVVGELGGTLQIPLGDSIAVYFGGGYNITTPVYTPIYYPTGYSLKSSNGYTIRAGGYFFHEKHRFLSLQFFYRKWANATVFNYNMGNGNDGSVTTDYVTDPLFSGITSDESARTGYYVNNISATVTDFSFVYGRQFLGRKRLFFEWYIGMGIRFKTINMEELGLYQQNVSYTPDKTPINSTSKKISPDAKLGFMIGYKL